MNERDEKRIANALASQLEAAMSMFIGSAQSNSPDDLTRQRAKDTITEICLNYAKSVTLDDAPFKIVDNNTPETIKQGFINFSVVDKKTGLPWPPR
jgi:hypothetical protein